MNNYKIFKIDEIPEILEMIQGRERDFKDTLMLEPFYLKAINTLRELMNKELDLSGLYT